MIETDGGISTLSAPSVSLYNPLAHDQRAGLYVQAVGSLDTRLPERYSEQNDVYESTTALHGHGRSAIPRCPRCRHPPRTPARSADDGGIHASWYSRLAAGTRG